MDHILQLGTSAGSSPRQSVWDLPPNKLATTNDQILQEPKFKQSIRQLTWQTIQMPIISMNTRGSRVTRSLEPWRFRQEDFLSSSQIPQVPQISKRESHHNELVLNIVPTPLPKQFFDYGNTPRHPHTRPKPPKETYDWVSQFRLPNQYDRLQPAVIDDPMVLREAISLTGSNSRDVKPDLLKLSLPEMMTTELPDSRTAIMSRMFCSDYGNGRLEEKQFEEKLTSQERIIVEKLRREAVGDEEGSRNAKPTDILVLTNEAVEPKLATKAVKPPIKLTTTTTELGEEGLHEFTRDQLFEILNKIPLTVESKAFPVSPDTQLSIIDTPRSKLKIFEEQRRIPKALESLMIRDKPIIERARDDKDPEIFVAVGDKEGPRLQRLKFRPQRTLSSKKRKETLTTGIQVDERTLFESSAVELEDKAQNEKIKIKRMKQQQNIITEKKPLAAEKLNNKPDVPFKMILYDEVEPSKAPLLGYGEVWPETPKPLGDTTTSRPRQGHPLSNTRMIEENQWNLYSRQIPHLVLPDLHHIEEDIERTTDSEDIGKDGIIEHHGMATANEMTESSKTLTEDSVDNWSSIQKMASTLMQRRDRGLEACRGGRRFALLRRHRYGKKSIDDLNLDELDTFDDHENSKIKKWIDRHQWTESRSCRGGKRLAKKNYRSSSHTKQLDDDGISSDATTTLHNRLRGQTTLDMMEPKLYTCGSPLEYVPSLLSDCKSASSLLTSDSSRTTNSEDLEKTAWDCPAVIEGQQNGLNTLSIPLIDTDDIGCLLPAYVRQDNDASNDDEDRSRRSLDKRKWMRKRSDVEPVRPELRSKKKEPATPPANTTTTDWDMEKLDDSKTRQKHDQYIKSKAFKTSIAMSNRMFGSRPSANEIVRR